MKSIKLNLKNLKNQDLVYILTNHSNINYRLIENHAKKIIDTRNVFKKKSIKINTL
mgnify:FL=1